MSHLSAPARRLSADALDPPAQNHVRPRYGSCGNIPIDIHRLILSSLLSAASEPSPATSSSCDLTDRSSLVAYACSSKALAAIVLPELYRHVRLPLTEGSLISLLRAGLDASVLDLHANAGARVIDVAGAYGQEEPLKAVLLRGNDSGSTGRTTESVPSVQDPSYLDAVRTLQTAYGRTLSLSPASRIRIPTLIFSLSFSTPNPISSVSSLPPPLAPTPSAPPVPRSRPSSPNLPYTYLPIALHAALAHLLTALDPRRLVLAGPAMCLHLTQPIPWLIYRLAARVDEVVLWLAKTPEQVGADDDRPGEGYHSVLRMSGDGAEPDRVGIMRVLQEIGKAVGRWYTGGAVSTATPVMLDLNYDADTDTDLELASSAQILRSVKREVGEGPARQGPAPAITIVLALPPNERYEPPGPPYSSMAMTMEFHPDYAPGWFHALCKAWATPLARLLLSHAEGAERSGAAARAEAWGRVRRQAGEQAGGEAQGHEMVVEPAVTVQYNDDPPVQPSTLAWHHVLASASVSSSAAQPSSTSRDHHTPSPPSPSPKPKSTTTGPLIRLVNFGALAGTSAGLPQASYTEIQDRLGRGLRVCIHRALHWSRHELGVGVGEGVDTRDEDGALVGRVEMVGMEGWLRDQGGGGGRGGVDGDRDSDRDRDRALDGQGGGGAGSAAGLSSSAEKRDPYKKLGGPEQILAWMREIDASLAAKYRAYLQPKVYW